MFILLSQGCRGGGLEHPTNLGLLPRCLPKREHSRDTMADFPPDPLKELAYRGCPPSKIILVPTLFCPYQHCFASQRTDTCPSKLLPFCLEHTKGVTVNSWSLTAWDHDNVSLFHSVSVPNFLTLHFFTSPHTPGINPIRSNSSCQKHVRLVILHNCTVPNCSHKPSWNTWEHNYRFSDIETKLTNHITRAFQ